MTTPTAISQTFDNSRLAAYKFCPRSYFIRHVLHFTRIGNADALVFGSSWHAGMDAMWKHGKDHKPMDLANIAFDGFLSVWVEEGFPSEPSIEMQDKLGARTPGNAKEMFFNYATARYRMLQEANVLAIEQPFAVPIPAWNDVWYIGKLDKVVQWNQNRVILEHKTTSDYAIQGGIQPRWIESWFNSAQVKGYGFAGELYFGNLDGVWVDGALVHKKVHDVFKFVPVKHSYNMLVEWLEDTKNWITRVVWDTDGFKQAGKLTSGNFPRNEDNCFGKFGPCPFLDICRHTVDPSQLDGPPEGFIEKKWEPFSTLGLDKLVQQSKEKTNEA